MAAREDIRLIAPGLQGRRAEQSYQFKALFRKNATLKKRQSCSNCCHLTIPLLITLLVGGVGELVKYFTTQNGTQLMTNDPVALNPYFNFDVNSTETNGPGQCLIYYYSVDGPPDTAEPAGSLLSNGTGSGMLGTIASKIGSRCLVGPPTAPQEIFVPYFDPMPDANAVDQQLYDIEKGLRAQANADTAPNQPNQTLSDGAVLFNRLDFADRRIDYTLQTPDSTEQMYGYLNLNAFTRRNNISSERVPSAINMINSAFVQSIANGTGPGSKGIVATIQEFDYKVDGVQAANYIMMFMGFILFPLGLSLLMPSFIYLLVLEKQEKLRELMKMMGMSMPFYWLVTWLFDYVLFILVGVVFLIVGVCFQIQMFTEPSVLILLLLTWGNALIGLSFLLSAFISRNRTITAFLLYMLVIIGSLVSFALNLYFAEPGSFPWYLMLYPPFAFYRALFVMQFNCFVTQCPHVWTNTPEVAAAFGYLWVEILVLFALALYLDAVLPQAFGVRKPAHFPILYIKQWLRRRQQALQELPVNEEAMVSIDLDVESTKAGEDDDVAAERRKVQSGQYGAGSLLVIKGLTKQYEGKTSKLALDDLYLCVDQGECFGLLGPNGAGKTTTISILTGLFGPTKGTATIDGYDIVREMDKVHSVLGICPQFDVQWPTLTVEEHLLFYARLKGVPPADEVAHVLALATEVGLQTDLEKKSSELSGGMRRRLSVAMALIGNPKMVFLDEPTSGLDPTSRRNLWDVLDRYKKGNRTMVLTTHSMQEADALCTRIGIIAKGRLQCVGSQMHLKSKFGKGYSFVVSYKDPAAVEYIDKLLGPRAQVVNEVGKSRIYRIPKEDLKVSTLLEEMNANATKLHIEDWGISQTSLEEVFISICREEADAPEETK